MKIAHLISTYLPSIGGAEVCVHNLAAEQGRKGHTVKVIAPVKAANMRLGYKILPLWPRSVFFSMLPLVSGLYFVRQLAKYQKEHRFDIWQVTIGYPFGTASAEFFNKNSIPCILRCSGEDIQTEPMIKYGARLHKWPNFLIEKNYPKFDGVVSIVKSITDDLINIGIPRKKIHYIPNGINRSAFNISADRDGIKKSLGIRADKKLIVTVGRNHPKKNFNIIPDCIQRLSGKRSDFVWLLLGKGNKKIKSAASKKGVGEFLITKEPIRQDAGALSSMPPRMLVEIYKSADIFALPTLIEGCSNVIAEAQAAGLPVVSTDVAGVRDIIEHEETGLLSKKGDAAAMARNIERLLDDKALSGRISRNGLKAAEGLGWPSIADRYIDVYDHVLKEKRR